MVERRSGKVFWRFPGLEAKLRLVTLQELNDPNTYHVVLTEVFNTLPDRTSRVFLGLSL